MHLFMVRIIIAGIDFKIFFVCFFFCSQVFCWIDKWYGMTMEDIRALEDKVREELDRVISS
jgi:hypothetical protein